MVMVGKVFLVALVACPGVRAFICHSMNKWMQCNK